MPWKHKQAALKRGFNRLASHYENNAALAREIEARLISHLDDIRIAPTHIANLGCGASKQLIAESFPAALQLHIDIAQKMLADAGLAACADCHALPVRSGWAELVYSNLMLPWCRDPKAIFSEARRIAALDGLFLFSTLGPDTIRELREARHELSEPPDTGLPDMHNLGDLLLACGFTEPVMETEILTISYPSLPALLHELKSLGGTVLARRHHQGLAGRSSLERLSHAYPAPAADGRMTITLEVIYSHAWATAPAQGHHTDPAAPAPLRHWR